MPQIIDQPLNLGAVVGSSLGNLLQELAASKASQIASQRQQGSVAQGLRALGIPQQEAMNIARLPEQLQGLVVKNYLSAAESQGLNEALASLTGETPSQAVQPGAQQFYQQATPPQNPQLAALQNLIAGGQPITPGQFGMQLGGEKLIPQGGKAPMMPGAEKTSVIPTYTSPEAKAQRQQSFAETLRASRLSPEYKLKIAAMQQAQTLQKEKLSAKEQELVNKETKPIYDEISKGAKAAQNNNKRLDRMEVLIKEGKLDNAAYVGILENLGGIFSAIGSITGLILGGPVGAGAGGLVGAGLGGVGKALLSPQSQEFNKLSNDFLRDAKDTFGSRLTNYDVQTFLATVPTLSQTDEGKQRVITNLRSFNEAAMIRKKAMDQIIRENGGRRPVNLDTLVEERVSPQLDVIAEKFKKGEKL